MMVGRLVRAGRLWRHLSLRWWLAVTAGPPTAAEEVWARDHLSATERSLWDQMSPADRRHAVMVAERFLTLAPEAGRAEVAAALLHDVGKIDAGLGTWARVLATVWSPRRIPAIGPLAEFRQRVIVYRDHELRGVEMAERAGSDPATLACMRGEGPLGRYLYAADQI